MRKQKITRAICLVLAFLFLVSTAAVAVGAEKVSSVTDKSIADYADVLNTDSYEEYKNQKHANLFLNYQSASTTQQLIDAKLNWVFEREVGTTVEVIEIKDGAWKMTVYQKIYGKDSEGKDTVTYEVKATYDTTEAALAGLKGYTIHDLAYVGTFGGELALYTPDNGSVTWSIPFDAQTQAGLYNVAFRYYPVYIEGISKAAAIEREFYINGEAHFTESRSLTLQKVWASRLPDGVTALSSTYQLGKKEDINTFLAELKALEDEYRALGETFTYTVAEDQKSFTVIRPTTVTEKMSAFIDAHNLRFMILDASRNELRPTMVQSPEWVDYTIHDGSGFYANDFGFALTPDKNGNLSFTLDGVNEPMVISTISMLPYTELQSYQDYLNGLGAENVAQQGSGSVKVEAENTVKTSTNGVYPIEDRASAMTSPADTTRVMLNTIGTEKWATAGQWVEYDLAVPASGMYEIISRFKQSYLDGMYVSRALSIYTHMSKDEYFAKFGTYAGYYDGIPFAEAAELRYNYGAKWQITGLTAGTDINGDQVADTFALYFRQGVTYSVRFEVTLGSMSTKVQEIQMILDALNADYLSIIKLTGTSPDDYRDYNFGRLLPAVLLDMMAQSKNLADLSTFLKETANVASTYSGTCDKLSQLLGKLARHEDEIAKNLDNLKSYVGNLGTFLTDAKTQPLQLDYFVVQPATAELPKAEGNFFQSFWHECKSFIQSFKRDYNSMGAMADATSTSEIEVWLAYGRDQSQVIRNLTTNGFTPETTIAVNLKLITGSTLLPSILADMGPDVYLGLADATVINYAIRGALQNVEYMEGFDEMVDECFTRAAMLQLEISDSEGVIHTYGLPETQTFQMMFIRLDILEQLGIEIPRTWEDIYTAQSLLESNNMEIGLSTNYKVFLYQAEGDLYADDGMRINLDSVEGLAAFEKMCNLFTQHSFPYSYNAANRFRTGEMPIILSDYTGLYNQLKVFATEIDGRWTFVPIPGTALKDEAGNVMYDEDGKPMVNNTADSTIAAVVMISDIESPENAWKFMKWYTGKDCQTDYANEMVAIIGDSAKHPTANRVALESMPWTRDEYDEVSKQFENLAAIPNYPGSYYLDRHTNFAFLAAYNSDADPSTEILSYINTINKEITRKREEFNLETLEIGQTLAAKRMNQAMAAIEALEEKVGTESKYAAAIEAAKKAVANQRVTLLDDASLLFSAFLEYNYVPEIMAIESNSEMTDVQKTTAIKAIVANTKNYSYFKNVGKQTGADGYSIKGLEENQTVYFIAECLRNAADALASY